MVHITEIEVGALGKSQGSVSLRRVYKAPLAERLDVGQTAGGRPEVVVEGISTPTNPQRGQLGSS